MADTTIDTIIYRHNLDRAPVPEDQTKKIGFDEFVETLRAEGWVQGVEANSIKFFHIHYEGNAEPGNNYIEWKAVLD